jgi:hypothetical protein
MPSQTAITDFARTTATDAPLTPSTTPPYPETAADRGRSARARVWFDPGIADALEHIADERSCNVAQYGDRDKQNHLIGAAGELADATWHGGRFDTRIFDDFEGDAGVDVEVPLPGDTDPFRVQVKTTRDMENPERVVDRTVLETVDQVVLCCTNTPRNVVDIVGYIPSRHLQRRENKYGHDGPVIRSDNILPVPDPGHHYYPDDVRRFHDSQ